MNSVWDTPPADSDPKEPETVQPPAEDVPQPEEGARSEEVIESSPAMQVPPKPEEPQTPDDWKGLPVRSGGDKIFILKEGKKRWVTSPDAFEKLGFKFGDEVELDYQTLSLIPEGEPIR